MTCKVTCRFVCQLVIIFLLLHSISIYHFLIQILRNVIKIHGKVWKTNQAYGSKVCFWNYRGALLRCICLYTGIEILFMSSLNAFILACRLDTCMANFISFCSVNPVLPCHFKMEGFFEISVLIMEPTTGPVTEARV